MPTDPGDVDFYTPEEKQRQHEEWKASERGRQFYKGLEREERRSAVVGAVVWMVLGLLALIVSAAVLKWAIEELAK